MPLYKRDRLPSDRLLGGICEKRKGKEKLSSEFYYYILVSGSTYIILDTYGNQLRDESNSDFLNFGKFFFHSESYDTV